MNVQLHAPRSFAFNLSTLADVFAQASCVHVFFFNLIFTILNVRSQQFLRLARSNVLPYACSQDRRHCAVPVLV